MDSFVAARDRASRWGEQSDRSERGRSKSPPQNRIHPEREYIHRDRDRDREAPPVILNRKQTYIPQACTSASINNHSLASTSASSSSSGWDRNPPSSSRHVLPERPEAAAARRSSAVLEPRADTINRLYSLPAERGLFDQMELKRHLIAEDRRELKALISRIASAQAHLNKAATKDPRSIAKLTEEQSKQATLEQKIKSNTDDLYRMQCEWQLAVVEQITSPQLNNALPPLERKVAELRADIQDFRADSRTDRERTDEIETRSRQNAGQVNKFQSDILKLKADFTALRRSYEDDHIKIRKDVDKDVRQIHEHGNRIKRVEKDLASLQTKLAHPSVAQQVAAGTSSRSTSVAPSDSGSRQLATSPVRDSRNGPAQPASTEAAAASAQASTSDPATQTAQASTSKTSVSDAVTRAQFRKWANDFRQDLELQLDEIRELAVQEATAENQSCMDERLRLLARRWKEKAEKGEDLSGPAPQPEQNVTSTNAAASSSSTTAKEAVASEPTPMDVETDETENRSSAVNAEVIAPPNGVVAGASANEAPQPSLPAPAQPSPHVIDVSPPTPGTDSAATPAATAVVDKPSDAALGADATAAGHSASMLQAAFEASTASAQRATPSAKSDSPEGGAAKKEAVSMPVEALKAIRVMLKHHEKQVKEQNEQIAAINQKVATLQSLESKVADDRLTTPAQLHVLIAALKENGFQTAADAAAAAAVSQQNQQAITEGLSEMTAMRSLIQILDGKVKTLEQARVDVMALIQQRTDWLQRQLETLDDQSSLQGALLVKLSEHANPRKPPPAPTPTTPQVATAQARSPNLNSALPQQHHQQQQQQRQPQPQPQLVPQTQPIVMADLSPTMAQQTFAQQQAQAYIPTQQAPYQVPQAYTPLNHTPYPYQDPNQRRGYP